MKYIVVKNQLGREQAIVFPDRLIHSQVARRYESVISAGFCGRTPQGKWEAWGMSESLDKFSRPEDGDILANSSTESFRVGERVVYIPGHAEGDISHPDCECGKVSSTNEKFVFVRFDQHVKKFGWDGATSQACDPSDLKHIAT